MSEIRAEMAATVWKVNVAPGELVGAGDEVAVLESMKMEIPVMAPVSGAVTALHITEGALVSPGDLMVVLNPE